LFASVPPCSVSKSVANQLSDVYSRPAVSGAAGNPPYSIWPYSVVSEKTRWLGNR
jgi:hypothetical protein